MQNLIKQLLEPRPPSQAATRAAKALQELAALHQADLAGRLAAEQSLMEANKEIERLTNEISKRNAAADKPADAVS
jgi:hypothetical protein